jgi:hypothetical protein
MAAPVFGGAKLGQALTRDLGEERAGTRRKNEGASPIPQPAAEHPGTGSKSAMQCEGFTEPADQQVGYDTRRCTTAATLRAEDSERMHLVHDQTGFIGITELT